MIFSSSVFEKKSRYCHDPGVGVGVGVKNFNRAHNFFTTEANVLKLHTLVHHDKGYNLTKGHNSVLYINKIMPLFRLRDFLFLLIIASTLLKLML